MGYINLHLSDLGRIVKECQEVLSNDFDIQ